MKYGQNQFFLLQKNTLCAFVRPGGLFYGVNSGLENYGSSLALAAG
jgi:hypothetical protein